MSVAASAARMVALYGQTMTLRRPGETDLPLKGKRLPRGVLVSAGNTATQQEMTVLIAPTELAASTWTIKVPSASTDRLVVDGRARTILDVQPRLEGDTVALYDLLVAG